MNNYFLYIFYLLFNNIVMLKILKNVSLFYTAGK